MNNKEKLEKNKYKFVKARPYLCVAAVLEMVIKAYIPMCDISQNEIANFFGVGVEKGALPPVSNFYIVNEDEDIGIHIHEDSINSLFRTFNLSLEEDYIHISKLADYEFEDVLNELISKGNTLICGYSYGRLYNIKEKYDIGHVSIVTSVLQRKVQLLDPGPLDAGVKEVDIEDLYYAIRYRHDGIWKIKRKC